MTALDVDHLDDVVADYQPVYFSQKFVPRTSILSKLAPEKRQKMVEEAEKVLFEHLGFMEASEAKQAAEIDQMCSE